MTPAVSRARRHQSILELVRSRPIANQEALAELLSEHGHNVTQSTLSRDLKELRILRVPDNDGYRYLPAGEESSGLHPVAPSLSGIALAEVVAVAANEVSVVLRTQIGRAQGVAVYLDGLAEPDVLATLAGDDTVLVIPSSTNKVDALVRRLQEIFALPTNP